MGRHFIAIVRNTPSEHMWERLECLACGWNMVADGKYLDSIERHVCDVVDRPHWLEVVRDAFLSGDDRRAITIIETMEPNKLSYAAEIGQLRAALKAAIQHVEEHNNEYGHHTPNETIEHWKKIGGL